MNNKEIQSQLQALKMRLEAESFAEDGSCAEMLLICADLLLLIDQIRNTAYNTLIKQKALACIMESQAELDDYHEHYDTIAPYSTVSIKAAGNKLEKAVRILLFSYT